MMPTPIASDIVGGAHGNVEFKDAKWSRLNAKGVRCGIKTKDAVEGYIAKNPELLPTPQASEGEKFTNKYNPNSQMGQSLSAMAGSGLPPTPRANKVTDCDLNNENLANRNHANLEEEIAKVVTSCPKTDGEPFLLSPLFTEEMMGFPFLWTTLPFLSANGSEKA